MYSPGVLACVYLHDAPSSPRFLLSSLGSPELDPITAFPEDVGACLKCRFAIWGASAGRSCRELTLIPAISIINVPELALSKRAPAPTETCAGSWGRIPSEGLSEGRSWCQSICVSPTPMKKNVEPKSWVDGPRGGGGMLQQRGVTDRRVWCPSFLLPLRQLPRAETPAAD
ncbi:unnamed protein product [Pleuronectes platessa]|uniref:Uncharacterized protein n=1 Tax=Pleuronectes platessa TaxID=8262 RepID=A0A9N7U7N3_PLEPL|nr:unnamed protein product [Pleuronectes platessa]